MAHRNKPIGVRDARHILAELRQVRRVSTMGSATFDGICERLPITIPAKGVTDFIKARTHLWCECWVLNPLDRCIALTEELLEDR